MLEKFSTKKSFTMFPISVGTNFPLSDPTFSVSSFAETSPPFNVNCVYLRSVPSIVPLAMYSLLWMVEMVGA